MITVRKEGEQITISGHALYAPVGEDIVCAGVSALVQGFIASMDDLGASYVIKEDCKIMIIKIKSDTTDVKLLTRSFFIGLSLIEREYPDYIRCPCVERR